MGCTPREKILWIFKGALVGWNGSEGANFDDDDDNDNDDDGKVLSFSIRYLNL